MQGFLFKFVIARNLLNYMCNQPIHFSTIKSIFNVLRGFKNLVLLTEIENPPEFILDFETKFDV